MNGAPEPGYTTEGRITRNIDGDTVDVEVCLKWTVRLDGCWAPESRLDHQIANPTKREAAKRLGQAAAAYLRELAVGKKCRVHIPLSAGKDCISRDPLSATTLGRVLGRVYLPTAEGNWVDLSELMVAAGHAGRTKAEQPQP